MANGIGEQVDDEPLDQEEVSIEWRRCRHLINVNFEARGFGLEPSESLLHQRGDVDRLTFTQTALTAGEGEQSLDQMCLFVVRGKHLFCGGAPFGVAGMRIIERNLEEIALGGEWGAQLVGSVGDEVLLGVEGTFKPREEAVEGVAELLELVLRAGQGQALVKARRGDPPGRAGDGTDGTYYFMWHPGHPATEQCEGCTWVTAQAQELSYLHSRDITYAVLCQGPYDESARYRDFMAWDVPWYSAKPSLDVLLVGRHIGRMHLVC